MKEFYLEVTFRHGRPIAAYLYLPRRPGEKSYRTAKAGVGLIVDFNREGKPIGIEITSPSDIKLPSLNKVLAEFGLPKIKQADLAPLQAA